MPSTLTDVQIASLALIDLGQPAIASFGNDDKNQRIMGALYEPTVREMLGGHPWRFARKQQILSTDDSAAPPFTNAAGDLAYACPLPADFLGVVKVNDNIRKFEVMGQNLMIDDTAPHLTYTARVDESLFDPGFVKALRFRLAADACFSITDNASAVEAFEKKAQTALQDAKMDDAMQGAPEDPPMGTWAQARL